MASQIKIFEGHNFQEVEKKTNEFLLGGKKRVVSCSLTDASKGLGVSRVAVALAFEDVEKQGLPSGPEDVAYADNIGIGT